MKPKIVAIFVVYTSPGSNARPFIHGDAILVESQEDLKATYDRLAQKFLRDGFEIQNQLFVEVTDSMIRAAAKGLSEAEECQQT